MNNNSRPVWPPDYRKLPMAQVFCPAAWECPGGIHGKDHAPLPASGHHWCSGKASARNASPEIAACKFHKPQFLVGKRRAFTGRPRPGTAWAWREGLGLDVTKTDGQGNAGPGIGC
jgi:hypothetical protein